MRYHDDKTHWRVVRDSDHYAIVHPSYDIPYGWSFLVSCETKADALAVADDYMDSDALLASL
jgi:hypothetical protein